MSVKKRTGIEIPSSEITPKHLYLSRRKFLKGAAAGAATLAGSAVLASCRPSAPGSESETPPGEVGATTDELGDSLTEYRDVVGYNNFYEFALDKESVASRAANFVTSPWQLTVGGLVNNPKTYDLDDLVRFDQEERIYRLRCVEAWSMVIPWIGFPLSALLADVEPRSSAKYVRFETLYDPEQMPGQRSRAVHDLTLLATGLYGEDLPPQNGAPVRLVVPWKYGFKNIKSIVKIDLVEEMPISLWMQASPREYGFYANVNPEVPHPRWSQATERRIGESGRRNTPIFNGYADQVAALYEGMDLQVNF